MKAPGPYLLILVTGLLVIAHAGFSRAATADTLHQWVEAQMKSSGDTDRVYKAMHRSLLLSERENNTAGRISAYLNLARYHDIYGTVDSAIHYFQLLKHLYLQGENHNAAAETCLELKGLYGAEAEYAMAMEQVYEALDIYEKNGQQQGIALCYMHIGDLLYYENKYIESVEYCDKAIAIQEQLGLKEDLALTHRYKASSLLFVEGKLELALTTINRAIDLYRENGETGTPLLASLNGRGNILKYMERYDEAIADYQYIYEQTLKLGLGRYTIPSLANIGHVLLLQKKYEEALPYHLEAIEVMKASGNTKNLWENYMHVSDIYAALGSYRKAFEYNMLYSTAYQDYLFTIIDRLESEAQIKYESAKKDETIGLQEAVIASQKRTQILYISIAILLVVSLIGMLQSRYRIRKKQKEIEKSREKLQTSLENLKATQEQLIHAEKMASLGELTAGIAHEIQNPLNFVNNFSDVSVDLVDELNDEITSGNQEEVEAISIDLKQNLEKIQHHGKRASSIVMNMLEHSRTGSGNKELTDLNTLADEYLRLAYHGIRAKDKSFQADYQTDLDPELKKIKIVPQDIGRVLLNLINNAFYAVSVASVSARTNGDADYKPQVTISTRQLDGYAVIGVKDNGVGISKTLRDKIFQPFFTTKPTGQGTGLGLSLSYDIIKKGHNGTLELETEEGKGSTFIIKIPVQG